MYYVQLITFGIVSHGSYNNTDLMCDGLWILFFLVNFDSCVNTIQTVCKNVAQLPNSKRITKLHSPACGTKVATSVQQFFSFVHSKRAPLVRHRSTSRTIGNRSRCATLICHGPIQANPGTPHVYLPVFFLNCGWKVYLSQLPGLSTDVNTGSPLAAFGSLLGLKEGLLPLLPLGQ
jgi:hypothetical protein